jgi:hypothetical protein
VLDLSVPRPTTTGAELADAAIPPGRLGLYFCNRQAYDAWAERADEEAPRLRTCLLTIDAPDGSRAVFFHLLDGTSLTPDGADALLDAARRLGSEHAEQAGRP